LELINYRRVHVFSTSKIITPLNYYTHNIRVNQQLRTFILFNESHPIKKKDYITLMDEANNVAFKSYKIRHLTWKVFILLMPSIGLRKNYFHGYIIITVKWNFSKTLISKRKYTWPKIDSTTPDSELYYYISNKIIALGHNIIYLARFTFDENKDGPEERESRSRGGEWKTGCVAAHEMAYKGVHTGRWVHYLLDSRPVFR